MGFWDSISDGFSSAFNGIKDLGSKAWSGVKGVGTKIWDSGIKPIYNKASGLLGKASDTAEKVADRVLQKADKLTDNTIDSIGGFGKLLGNPFVVITGLVAAVVILPKIIK
jgi:hypothetical protein